MQAGTTSVACKSLRCSALAICVGHCLVVRHVSPPSHFVREWVSVERHAVVQADQSVLGGARKELEKLTPSE